MKNIVVVAFLLGLTSSIANAQFRYDYPVVCDDTKKLIESLTINFKEKISWAGKHILGVGEESKIMINDGI